MSVRSGGGDKGFTDHAGKDRADICAMGDLDELVSYLGLVKSKIRSRRDKGSLEKIQHALMAIATEIAVGVEKKKKFGLIFEKKYTDRLQVEIYELERKCKVRKHFALPGKNELSAFLHITRTVARRAERSVVDLFRKDKMKNENVLSFLNCISDVLFLMARRYAQKTKTTVTETKKKRIAPLKKH